MSRWSFRNCMARVRRAATPGALWIHLPYRTVLASAVTEGVNLQVAEFSLYDVGHGQGFVHHQRCRQDAVHPGDLPDLVESHRSQLQLGLDAAFAPRTRLGKVRTAGEGGIVGRSAEQASRGPAFPTTGAGPACRTRARSRPEARRGGGSRAGDFPAASSRARQRPGGATPRSASGPPGSRSTWTAAVTCRRCRSRRRVARRRGRGNRKVRREHGVPATIGASGRGGAAATPRVCPRIGR